MLIVRRELNTSCIQTGTPRTIPSPSSASHILCIFEYSCLNGLKLKFGRSLGRFGMQMEENKSFSDTKLDLD